MQNLVVPQNIDLQDGSKHIGRAKTHVRVNALMKLQLPVFRIREYLNKIHGLIQFKDIAIFTWNYRLIPSDFTNSENVVTGMSFIDDNFYFITDLCSNWDTGRSLNSYLQTGHTYERWRGQSQVTAFSSRTAITFSKNYTLTSTKSNAARRSLMNRRIKARYFRSLGCLLKYSSNQYRKLLLWSFLAILTCMFTIDAIPSSSPAENGRGSPRRKALTWS